MSRCSAVFGFHIILAATLASGVSTSQAHVLATEQAITGPVPQSTSAQHGIQSPSGANDSSAISRGATLVGEFSQGLNVKSLRAGDKVKAVLTQDLLLKGKIIAPSGAKLAGHVTEIKAGTDTDPESRLGVVFDRLLLKHHHELAIQAGILALLPPAIRHSRVDEPDQMMAPGNGGRGGMGPVRNPGGMSPSSGIPLNSMANAKVQSTPGNSPGGAVSKVDVPRVGGNSLSASNGMRGVYGIKGLTLSQATNGPAVIIAKGTNLKLENGTQIILVVLR